MTSYPMPTYSGPTSRCSNSPKSNSPLLQNPHITHLHTPITHHFAHNPHIFDGFYPQIEMNATVDRNFGVNKLKSYENYF
jgi:hypothetical protein